MRFVETSSASSDLAIHLFGAMRVVRNGEDQASPASRKTRAILGFLALSPRPVSRQRLCEMFFDLPDDPRASLRWCLTKLRPLIDSPGQPRLLSERDSLSLARAGIAIDAASVLRLANLEPSSWTQAECLAALEMMQGQLLEDCELPDRSEYSAWLAAQRQDFHTISVRLANWLVEASSGTTRLTYLRRLIALDPYDEVAISALARELVKLGRRDEAHELVAQSERHLARAGLPPGPGLRLALQQKAAEQTIAPAPAAPKNQDGRLHVAILPFHNHSLAELDDGLAEGMLEAAIHMLSKFRGLRLASLASVIAFKHVQRQPASLCADLGVTHLIGGSILVREGTLRVRYRLLSQNGSLLTSGDFSHDEFGAAALLEDVPARLVTFLAHHLGDVTRKRSIELPSEARTPHDHLAAGIHLGFFAHPLDYPAALASFEAGLAIDPGHAPLNGYTAWAKGILGIAVEEPAHSLAMAQAHRAMAQANPDAETLAMGAWSAVHIGQDFEPALRTVELATRLNPLSRITWSASAWVRAMGGEVETPLRHWNKAEECNPLGANIDATHCGRAICCWMAGRFDEAVMWAKRGLDWQPSHPAGHMATVASAIAVGDGEAAFRRSLAMLQFYPAAPDIPAMSSIPIRDPETKARLLDAVREGAALARGEARADAEASPALIQTAIQR